MNRYDEILELRLAGLSFAEISRRVGVSRQRVQQILAPPKPIRDQVIARAEGRCQECGIEVGASGHVHHGSPEHRDGDWYNQIERLILLCVSCHKRVHDGGEVFERGEATIEVTPTGVVITGGGPETDFAILAELIAKDLRRIGYSVRATRG